MSLREYLNNNSAVATIVAVVLLIVALGIIYWTTGSRNAGPIATYYYDMTTQKLVAAEAQIPPFDTGSSQYTYSGNETGPAGVQAQVYSCTDSCDDIEPGMTIEQVEAAGGHVAYFSRYSMEGKRLMEEANTGGAIDPAIYDNPEMNQQLYATPGSDQWISEMSDAGQQVLANFGSKCGPGETATPCLP